MQAFCRKKVMFLWLGWAIAAQAAVAQTPAQLLRQADSLFAKNQVEQARLAYEKIAVVERRVHPVMYLKLAELHEQQDHDADALHYLNRYYEVRPSADVLRKMSDLAAQHDWVGYELNDFNLLVLLYKQYGHYLVGVMLALAAYVFGVLLIKKIKHQYILPRHLVLFLLYLLGVGILVNLPENYAVAIVRAPRAILRVDPSAAAPVADAVAKGNRLNVLGNNDVWLRVVWNNQLTYVRQSDVWLVD